MPVLKNTDEMSFAEIEKNIMSLGNKAREGKITIEDLQGGTLRLQTVEYMDLCYQLNLTLLNQQF